AEKFLRNTGPTSRDMATFARSRIFRMSMSSVEDSHVKTLATPESEKASTESVADCGRRWPGSLAWYDPATSSWRTYPRCLDGEWAEYSETWPRAATMRNGIVFPQVPLALLTGEIGSGLWPTPHGMSNQDYDGHGSELSMVVRVREGLSD